MRHKIIRGNEFTGICGRCGLQGDLRDNDCNPKLMKKIEELVRNETKNQA